MDFRWDSMTIRNFTHLAARPRYRYKSGPTPSLKELKERRDRLRQKRENKRHIKELKEQEDKLDIIRLKKAYQTLDQMFPYLNKMYYVFKEVAKAQKNQPSQFQEVPDIFKRVWDDIILLIDEFEDLESSLIKLARVMRVFEPIVKAGLESGYILDNKKYRRLIGLADELERKHRHQIPANLPGEEIGDEDSLTGEVISRYPNLENLYTHAEEGYSGRTLSDRSKQTTRKELRLEG